MLQSCCCHGNRYPVKNSKEGDIETAAPKKRQNTSTLVPTCLALSPPLCGFDVIRLTWLSRYISKYIYIYICAVGLAAHSPTDPVCLFTTAAPESSD